MNSFISTKLEMSVQEHVKTSSQARGTTVLQGNVFSSWSLVMFVDEICSYGVW